VRNDEVRITLEHPRYIGEPKDAPGKLSWEEGQTWRMGDAYFMAGGGSHWDSVDENGRLKRHHHDAADYDFPLYRSTDLREWRHVGSFFKNPDPQKLNLGVECGQMIPFGENRWLWDFTHSYLVGRIEQDRFIMDHADELTQKGNFTHWGGWLRDDAGRIVFQTTKILKLPVPELARLGWGRTHRLPLAATLTKSNRLVLQPVAELTKLRREHFDLSKPAKVGAHFEAQLTFTATAQGHTGLRLSDGKGQLDIFFDAAKQQLIIDPRKLPTEANHIPNDKRLHTQALTAKPGDTLTLRIFHDGALTEIFANDENSAHWAWFEHPDQIQISVLTRGVPSVGTKAEAWTMGTIWKTTHTSP
jgi:sucrose-6-phosphate hydrolase SacC (GH32 family)